MGVIITKNSPETIYTEKILKWLKDEYNFSEGDEKYFVYIHKNLKNNKIYVGQTKNPRRRWRSKGIDYTPHPGQRGLFFNAIKEDDWESFTHQIVAICDSRKEACETETKFIEEYKTYLPEFGYNITTGGENNSMLNQLSIEQQEAYRKRCSDNKKELWKNEEYRRKQQEGMQKVMQTEEYKQKMSESLTKYYSQEENLERHKKICREKRGQPVRCIELDLIFSSISEANEYFGKGTRNTAIHDFFRGKQKTAFGHTWEKIIKEEQ